jgi:transcriptional regulator with XRE-family HTH domain
LRRENRESSKVSALAANDVGLEGFFLSKGGRTLCGTSQESKEREKHHSSKLAEKAGIETTYLPDLENAKKEPCLRVIDMLATGLGVSMSDLLKNI